MVHIWLLSLDLPASTFITLSTALSREEQEQAGQFRFDRDRRRFMAVRGALRYLLAGYAGALPAALRFDRGPQGKPFLARPHPGNGDHRLEFNVSHAGELALLSFTRGRRLGVDVEPCRELPDMALVADRVFSSRERQTLSRLSDEERVGAFFDGWTRKEAYIKATGRGMSQPLHEFSVAFGPGAEPRLLEVAGEPDAPRRWRLLALPTTPGYRAAVIAEGQNWRPSLWRFPPDLALFSS